LSPGASARYRHFGRVRDGPHDLAHSRFLFGPQAALPHGLCSLLCFRIGCNKRPVLQPSVRFPYCRFEALPSRSGLQTWAKTVGRRPPLLVEPDAGAMLGHYALPLPSTDYFVDQPPHRPLSPTTGHAALFHFGEDIEGRVVGLLSPRNPADIVSQPAIVLTDRKGRRVDSCSRSARHRAGPLSRAAKAEYCQRCTKTSHDATKAAIRPISLGPAKNGAWP
jgi:hypothetical protein